MNDRAAGTALVQATIPALAVMTEDELCLVLQNSIYPGAALPSIKMVLGYCKSTGLDPMTKPVHIVPMDVKSGRKDANNKDVYEKRDVVMPGIELYRTKATSTGRYLGCSEPEFGDMVKMKFKEKKWFDNEGGGRSERTVESEFEYPQWCRVTVKRLVDGRICEFTAIEYWVENFATAGKYSEGPNAMWRKRPRGQLAKCTEAQALRKAFPDAIGAQPTAEEMEGKTLDGVTIDGATGVVVPASNQIQGPTSKSATKVPVEQPAIDGEAKREPDPAGEKTADGNAGAAAADKPMIAGQISILRARARGAALSDADICAHFGVERIEDLKFSQFETVQTWIAERGRQVTGG